LISERAEMSAREAELKVRIERQIKKYRIEKSERELKQAAKKVNFF
jgi:hypothetical protein